MKTDGTRFKKARQAPRNEKPSSKGGENDGPVIIVFILVVLTASVKGEREVELGQSGSTDSVTASFTQ